MDCTLTSVISRYSGSSSFLQTGLFSQHTIEDCTHTRPPWPVKQCFLPYFDNTIMRIRYNPMLDP